MKAASLPLNSEDPVASIQKWLDDVNPTVIHHVFSNDSGQVFVIYT